MATFFSAGFGQYLESGEFGDVALVAAEGGERFVAHRLVLAYSSAHFARLLLPQPPSPSARHSNSCPSSPSGSSPSSSRAPSSSSRCGSPLASPTAPPGRTANRSVSSDGALLGGFSAALVDDDGIDRPKATKKKKKKKKRDKDKEKRKEQRRAKKGKERALSSGNESTEGSSLRDSSSSSLTVAMAVAVAAPTVPVATTSGDHKAVGEGAADKGSGTASGETAAEGGAAQPQIPAPPPPPVRLARRATGGSTSSGSVVLQRPSAQTLKRSNDTHHHHHHHGIAISRSLSGSSNFFSSVRRGGGGGGGTKTASGSVMTLSSFGTPRSCSSSLSGEGAALAESDLTTQTMDEVIYSPSSTPPSTAGHERQAAVADELPVIQLDFPDPNRIFPAVLRFIYEVRSRGSNHSYQQGLVRLRPD